MKLDKGQMTDFLSLPAEEAEKTIEAMKQEDDEKEVVMFDDPTEVMAQLEALGWMLGQAHEFGTINERHTHGLYCIVNMIGENVQSMIDKLETAAQRSKT